MSLVLFRNSINTSSHLIAAPKMYPPSRALDLDVEAISGILGSISIACWVVVFTPQIVENFRRKSAEAVSIWFIVIWLAGDLFNIAGAVLQRVLATMVSTKNLDVKGKDFSSVPPVVFEKIETFWNASL